MKLSTIWESFDPELLMERQMNKLCQVCYFHLGHLRTVRRSLTKESLLMLVHAFITSRVDHWNGVLYGSNGYLLDWLQSILNSAARLILGVPKFDSIFCRHPQWTSLAADRETHSVQDRSPRMTLYRQCGSRVLDRTLSSGEFILWSAESTLCLTWWSHCSETSDFEDLATGLLLSLGPTCGTKLPTEIRQSSNNLLQFRSKLKTFLFQQSWALLWIHI